MQGWVWSPFEQKVDKKSKAQNLKQKPTDKEFMGDPTLGCGNDKKAPGERIAIKTSVGLTPRAGARQLKVWMAPAARQMKKGVTSHLRGFTPLQGLDQSGERNAVWIGLSETCMPRRVSGHQDFLSGAQTLLSGFPPLYKGKR